MHIVFTTLAINQTHYFIELCQGLIKEGHEASIISFHEESVDLIKSKGIKVFNIFEYIKNNNITITNLDTQFQSLLQKYNIDCPNILLSHEKVSFEIKDTNQLKKKFVLYFEGLDKIFNELNKTAKNPVALVQELGGFASIVSAFYVARKMQIDNIFLEPSFFKGRMFFVKNTFDSYKVKEMEDINFPFVTEYLKKAQENKTIVIPKKDVTHYRHPLKKIINAHNIKRLLQKTLSKYLTGKQEEFNYIWSFVFRHLRMLANRILLIKYYKQLPEKNFIYYPFHVPMDVALTVRAPLFVDQYSLIDYISRNIPDGYVLAIKEHPAMIGVVYYNKLKDILERNDNIVLLNPDINNHEVMSKMKLLVTVNSKTGAESLMLGKKVLCLGDAFYNQSSSIKYVENIKDLYKVINAELENKAPSANKIETFFQSAYAQTYKGELYFCEKENIKDSVHSIISYFKN